VNLRSAGLIGRLKLPPKNNGNCIRNDIA
jgi:hypothetical protein